MIFYPTPKYENHIIDESILVEICSQYGVKAVDIPQYYDYEPLEQFLKSNFSKESLFLRTLPDKLLLTNPPIFIDVKTIFRKDTGNIAIELSSYFYTIQRSATGLNVYYFYIDEIPLVFKPNKMKPTKIYVQPKWTAAIRDLFIGYAYAIMGFCGTIPIVEAATEGSQDPFVLISRESLKKKSFPLSKILEQLLEVVS